MRKRFQEAIFSQVAEQVVRLSAVALLALGAWALASDKLPQLGAWTYLIGAGLALLAVAVALSAQRRWSFYRCHYPPYDFNFVVLSKHITYTRDSVGTVTFKRKLKVKALRSGLDGFADRYLWTGGDASLPTVVSGAAAVLKMEDRPGSIWTFFEVSFGRNLNLGEEFEYEVQQVLDDSQIRSRPFFSTSLEEPTRELIMELHLPADLNVHRCVTETLRGIESMYPFNSEEQELDSIANGYMLKWRVKSPKLYHHYRVHWRWPSVPQSDPNQGTMGTSVSS